MSYAVRATTKKIGELLVAKGLVTRIEVDHAVQQQKATGEFIGAVLVRTGSIAPKMLLEALSEQFGIPHEALSINRVDWSVSKQFSKSVLSEGKCFPIRADATSITIALSNPLDSWILSDMEKVLGAKMLKVVLVIDSELQSVVKEHSKQSLKALEARLRSDGKCEIE